MARERKGTLYKKTRTVDGKRVKSTCYYGSFTDSHTGKRITKKLYSDKQASRRELDRMIEEAERKATGIIDRFAEHRTRPIAEHIQDYLDHCEHVEQSPKHRQMKRTDLYRVVNGIGAKRLTDLEPNAVQRFLQGLRNDDLSARKINVVRANAVAFMSWCVETGRYPDNPLSIISRLDERKDRRRIRRAMSEEELGRLLDVAGASDRLNEGRHPPRRIVYLTAALSGLRRGELGKITWGDIDLESSTLRIRVGVGKAKREDHIPIHPQLHGELASLRPQNAKPKDPVFAAIPRVKTFYRDLERARQQWIEEAGDDVEERERREKSDFLAREDHEGRVVDLHALRTTLGTNLALAGVSPQLAQRIMRHSDYRTTLSSYTVLGLHDTARAMESLPGIGGSTADDQLKSLAATGTDDSAPRHGRDVVAPVVANDVHSMPSEGTNRHFDHNGEQSEKRSGDDSQVRDLSTSSASRQRASQRGRGMTGLGLEPRTSGLKGRWRMT